MENRSNPPEVHIVRVADPPKRSVSLFSLLLKRSGVCLVNSSVKLRKKTVFLTFERCKPNAAIDARVGAVAAPREKPLQAATAAGHTTVE